MSFFFVWFAALFALAAIITYEKPFISAVMAFTSFVCVGTVAMAVM
jgi:hypothetical protein